MDLRKLRKFIKENKNLSFVENTTETQREFIIEQKESKYKLRALLSENNTKLKIVLENSKNLVVEEYETTIENNDDMINKVKDAVALYDMIDTIDDNKETDNLDIDNDFIQTLPNSIEDEVNDGLEEDLLIDQPKTDQDIELVEKTKKEKEGKEDHISDELGLSESLSGDFNSRYAIKTNGGYVKLINNNNSYQIVESADSATYSSDKDEMKSQLIKLAKQENRPLKAGKIVDLNEIKAEEEEGLKNKDIEIAGNKPSEISSNGSISESKIKLESLNGTEEMAADDALYEIRRNKIIDIDKIKEIVSSACHKYNEGNAEPEYEDEEFYEEEADVNTVLNYVLKNLGLNESLEIKINDDKENNEEYGIKQASKLINDALKIIKDLQEKETDGTIKTILGSIDLNIQIPQGQIDELKNIMK